MRGRRSRGGRVRVEDGGCCWAVAPKELTVEAESPARKSLGPGASQQALENYVPAVEIQACDRCSAAFGFFCWKHHCRGFGACVCNGCSQWRKVVVAGQPEVRVSDDCFRSERALLE